MVWLGKRNKIKDSIDIADKYLQIAKDDESAAAILKQSGYYNQAGYLYIQAMEKYIKHHIGQRVNLNIQYYAEEMGRTIGHSLNSALELFIKIYAADNKTLYEQMMQQLKSNVLQNIDFKYLHNKTRYPMYDKRYSDYVYLEFSKKDCVQIENILANLKKYLQQVK